MGYAPPFSSKFNLNEREKEKRNTSKSMGKLTSYCTLTALTSSTNTYEFSLNVELSELGAMTV